MYSTPSIVAVVADVIVNGIAAPFFAEKPPAPFWSSAGKVFGLHDAATDAVKVEPPTM